MLGIVAILFVILILFIQEGDTQLRRILDRGEIRFVLKTSAHKHYAAAEDEDGFEEKFAQLFAEYLNVDLRTLTADNLNEILTWLDDDKADIAAAGLADNVHREPPVRYSKPYQIVDEKVVYFNGKHRPKNIQDLTQGKLMVGSQTSYAEKLDQLKIKYTTLNFQKTDEFDAFTLMDKVISGEIDYTIVDSHDLEQYRRFHPELTVAFDFTTAQKLAMAFKPMTRYPGLHRLIGNIKNAHIFPETMGWIQDHLPLDNSLVNKVNTFLDQLDNTGELDWLLDIYYGHLQDFDFLDTRTFLRRTKGVLPHYIPLFRLASKTDLAWELLAAISYQESHWNPNATSPTGVRGMMMLTLNTARSLNVTNRLDPSQSILGGAQYFRRLYGMLPSEIQEPDRTWITLACYNIGLGHILDVRKLIAKNGGNPNQWQTIREWLPRKHQAKWYSQTRYGFARGREAVIYVENIRRYHDLLKWINEKSAQDA
jgi:membrane-bound lytic murein transglycosylase F